MKYKSFFTFIFTLIAATLIPWQANAQVTVTTTDVGGGFKLHTFSGPDVPLHQELGVRANGDIVFAGLVQPVASGTSRVNQGAVTIVSGGTATATNLPGASDVSNRPFGIHTVSVSPNAQYLGAGGRVFNIDDLNNPQMVPDEPTFPGSNPEVRGVANNGNAAVVLGGGFPGKFNASTGTTSFPDLPINVGLGVINAIDASSDILGGFIALLSPSNPMATIWNPNHSFLPVANALEDSSVRSLSPNGLEAVGFEGEPFASTVIGMWWSNSVRIPLAYADGSPFLGKWFAVTDSQILGGQNVNGQAVIYSPGLGSVMLLEDWFTSQNPGVSLGFTPTEVYDIAEANGIVYLGIRGSEHFLEAPASAFGVGNPNPTDEVEVDVKPASCTNPVNTNSKGKIPVAIIGTSTFDVQDVDVSTILLEGVSPVHSGLEDVTSPLDAESGDVANLECTEQGPDGITDLTLKFETQAVVGALGEVADGDVVPLALTANLLDGTPITGGDIFVLIKKKK